MKYLQVLVLLCLGQPLCAQRLAVNRIDEALTKKANVVVRSAERQFKVLNAGQALETYHLELTILNETGKREAQQYVVYSDLEKVLEVSGEIYDKYGNSVKKIKKSEIEDISLTGGNMYTDNRVQVLEFPYPSYPYTIIFNYKKMHDGLMFYPTWDPQDHYKTSVERSKFVVRVPKTLGLNYYEHMVEGRQHEEGNEQVFEWVVENLAGFDPEPYGPPARELTPYVLTTPKKFEMEGYAGSMDSWKSIGEYDYELIKGQDELPEGAIMEIEKELSGITDKREKAKRIYEYVQNSTRYVSVQLGIGGWRPYNAAYVYENGYGDCKALTNYTAALLRHAGIESIYTSVLAGGNKPDIVTEFPNPRFNHVFLAVPFEEDTVWLECTSQSAPFGYLGSFTSDRHVLMTTEEGGVLVKTPTYTEEDNLQIRFARVELGKDGNATATISTEYTGLQFENIRGQFHRSAEEQQKWLLKKVKFDNTHINSFAYQLEPGKVPKATETLEVVSRGFGDITGNRIFFEANPLNRLTKVPRKVKDRKTPVHINMAYTDIDSIQYVLPEGYHVEYLPEPKVIETPFARYSTNYTLTEDGLIYVRKMVRWQGVYPPESYEAFRTMMKEIVRSDKTKIVLAGST